MGQERRKNLDEVIARGGIHDAECKTQDPRYRIVRPARASSFCPLTGWPKMVWKLFAWRNVTDTKGLWRKISPLLTWKPDQRQAVVLNKCTLRIARKGIRWDDQYMRWETTPHACVETNGKA